MDFCSKKYNGMTSFKKVRGLANYMSSYAKELNLSAGFTPTKLSLYQTNTGHTHKNGAVLIVFNIKTAPFFCVCPVYIYLYLYTVYL